MTEPTCDHDWSDYTEAVMCVHCHKTKDQVEIEALEARYKYFVRAVVMKLGGPDCTESMQLNDGRLTPEDAVEPALSVLDQLVIGAANIASDKSEKTVDPKATGVCDVCNKEFPSADLMHSGGPEHFAICRLCWKKQEELK